MFGIFIPSTAEYTHYEAPTRRTRRGLLYYWTIIRYLLQNNRIADYLFTIVFKPYESPFPVVFLEIIPESVDGEYHIIFIIFNTNNGKI